MTKINSVQDLMRVLDENPEWMEAVRARVLPRRVLELPDTLDQLSENVEALSQARRDSAIPDCQQDKRHPGNQVDGDDG